MKCAMICATMRQELNQNHWQVCTTLKEVLEICALNQVLHMDLECRKTANEKYEPGSKLETRRGKTPCVFKQHNNPCTNTEKDHSKEFDVVTDIV